MSDTPNTALVPVEQRAALALNATETEQHLAVLATKHKELTVIKNKDGREQVHGAAMELLKARTAIAKVSKTARDDATKFAKAVIAEEERLIALISPEEKRLFALRDEWDAEQERIRQEKVLAEQRRVERINAAIAEIAAIPTSLANASADVISAALGELEARNITEQDYEEFTEKAVWTRSEALQALTTLWGAAAEREAEAKRLAEEQARLAAERAELERQRQELEEAKARAAAEAALAAQRAADEATAKAKAEAAQREAFERQQRDIFEAEKREAEAKIKAEQEALAAERAEIARINAERIAKEAAEQAAREVAERNALLAKQEAERKARELEELAVYHSVVDAIQSETGLDDMNEIHDLILRAAAVVQALNNEEVTA
jgi:hypothetical protein